VKIAVQKNSGGFWQSWVEALKASGNQCHVLDLRSSAGFDAGLTCDGIMWHIDMRPSIQMAAQSILNTLEFSAGKMIFPNFNTRWHFDNKLSQTYLFRQMGINAPENHVFWNESEAVTWLVQKARFPVVAKLRRGASSQCVYILHDARQAIGFTRKMFSLSGMKSSPGGVGRTGRRIIRDILRGSVLRLPRPLLEPFLRARPWLKDVWQNEKGYVYFQEYIPDNSFDTRITIIGNRAFAFRRENRSGDFRASGSGSIHYGEFDSVMEMVNIAYSISDGNGFQSMAYDFLIDSGRKPSLVEMSYGYQSKAVFDCPGHWDRKLNWVSGNVLPETAHVEDFLAALTTGKQRSLLNTGSTDHE